MTQIETALPSFEVDVETKPLCCQGKTTWMHPRSGHWHLDNETDQLSSLREL